MKAIQAAAGVDRDRAKKRAKRPASSYDELIHRRVLCMMSGEDQALLANCFDESFQIKRRDHEGEGDAPRAKTAGPLWRYQRHRVEVERWLSRRVKDDVFHFAVPDVIWLQPDLSPAEKLLLADIWHLQQQECGCFKSNAAFAIDLGMPACVVANMISNLKRWGFLVSRPGYRRSLRLSDSVTRLVENVNKTKGTGEGESPPHRKVKLHSSESDSPITGLLDHSHRNVKSSSLSDDRQESSDQEELPEDEEDSHPLPPPKGQEKKVKTTTTSQGSAASLRQEAVVAPSESSGAAAPGNPCRGASPPATPSNESVRKESAEPDQNNDRPDRLVNLYQRAYRARFGKAVMVTERDWDAINAFFKESDWGIAETILVVVESWELIGVEEDGFQYGACQHPDKLRTVLNHFDDVLGYVSGQDFPDRPVRFLIHRIAELSRLPEPEVEAVFSTELKEELEMEAHHHEDVWEKALKEVEETTKAIKAADPALPSPIVDFWRLFLKEYCLCFGQLPDGWRSDAHWLPHSGGLTDPGVQNKILVRIRMMCVAYRDWTRTRGKNWRYSDAPTWPCMSNILRDKEIMAMLESADADGRRANP